MAELRTRAVLLRQVDTGEADRVVTLLTEARGRVSAIARGARRSRKRFGAALGLFVLAEATLRRGRGSGGLYTLTGYEAVQTFPGISSRLGGIAHASYITELVRELSPADQQEPVLYELLLQAYHHLHRHPPGTAALRWLEHRALSAAGLEPQLESCVRCGTAVGADAGEGTAEAGIDVDRGGVTCPACTRAEGAMAPESLAALRALSRVPLTEAGAVPWSPTVDQDLRRALGGIVSSTLGRPLKSVEFIRKMHR
jgi:DNA repair protein RecO (recombination protein O)